MIVGGPTEDRTPPMTPQLALRVALVGGAALVMFALIFFRLWFLQVLDGSHYEALSRVNSVRVIPVAAPRGEIVDSSGTVLVGSKSVPAVLVSPESLPVPISLDVAHPGRLAHQPAADYALYRKLDRLLGTSAKPHTCKYEVYKSGGVIDVFSPKLAQIPCLIAQGVASSQYANVTIKSNVQTAVQDYIAEQQSEFPGVLSQDVFIRTYPLKQVGAQMFGTLGELTASEVTQKHFHDVAPGSEVGQSGLEYQYNPALQGVDGKDRIKVNSEGQFEGYARKTDPLAGNTLKTSLDLNVEETGEKALAKSIRINGGTGGSFIAMDPTTGAVYAMGSLPSFNPSIFEHPVSDAETKKLFGLYSGDPEVNRADDSPLPDGSTFKVVTAIAALESHKWYLGETYDDDAKFCMGPPGPTQLCLQNSGGVHDGVLDLQQALEESDDEFFYNLGLKMNVETGNGGALQAWAAKFGLGQTTGVDLPGEANGEIGSPNLQKALYKQEIECQNATGPYAYTNAAGQISSTKLPGYHRSAKVPAKMVGEEVVSGGCAIASAPYWTEGDNVETGVGQYDDQVTPLQLGVVYAAIENGGKIVTPHIGQEIESPTTGQVLASINSAPKRELDIDPAYLAAIQNGLHLAATGPTGTSTTVMGSFPEPVYGKTGTAELGPSVDSPEDAWYACYVPASATNKPIVVVVNVDKGGFGAVAAAPVAREILSQWFLGKPGPYIAGQSTGNQK
jgi:penicillin-binding protein 2